MWNHILFQKMLGSLPSKLKSTPFSPPKKWAAPSLPTSWPWCTSPRWRRTSWRSAVHLWWLGGWSWPRRSKSRSTAKNCWSHSPGPIEEPCTWSVLSYPVFVTLFWYKRKFFWWKKNPKNIKFSAIEKQQTSLFSWSKRLFEKNNKPLAAARVSCVVDLSGLSIPAVWSERNHGLLATFVEPGNQPSVSRTPCSHLMYFLSKLRYTSWWCSLFQNSKCETTRSWNCYWPQSLLPAIGRWQPYLEQDHTTFLRKWPSPKRNPRHGFSMCRKVGNRSLRMSWPLMSALK